MIQAVVIQGKKVDRDRAKRIAESFSCELTENIPQDKEAMYFIMDKTGLSFMAKGQLLKGDFTRLLPRVSAGHLQHEILLKVARGASKGGDDGSLRADAGENVSAEKMLRALDATAGLGEDSFILAAGGMNVEMFEHNPVTAALLGDALIRGRQDPATKDICRRMTMRQGDSKILMQNLNYTPDIIYLDPMFPEKKKSAESKKKLQVLHKIEEPCSDETELLQAAMALKAGKIIIKRPPGCEYLAQVKPTYSLERKAVRFDCIVM